MYQRDDKTARTSRIAALSLPSCIARLPLELLLLGALLALLLRMGAGAG